MFFWGRYWFVWIPDHTPTCPDTPWHRHQNPIEPEKAQANLRIISVKREQPQPNGPIAWRGSTRPPRGREFSNATKTGMALT